MDEVIDLTDITKICRLCLKNCGYFQPLCTVIEFENQELAPLSVADAIFSLTSKTIDEETSFPKQICLKCSDLVRASLLFKFKFEKSLSILETFLSTKNKQKTAIVEESNNDEPNLSDDDDDDDRHVENFDSLKFPPFELVFMPDNENGQETSDTSIRESKNEINDEEPVLHPCPVCFVELPALELRNHIHTHPAFKNYLNVPKVSPNAKFYATPKKNVTAPQPNRLHNCPFCNKDIPAAEFLAHVDNHRFDGEFACDKCNRTFRKISNLRLHRLKHLKEYPYQCHSCEKGFVIKKNYDYHILRHQDILPYVCEFCNKKFSNPEHLHRHRTLHTENISYSLKYKSIKCRSCLNTFKNDELATNHICKPVLAKLHCKFCRKVFRNPTTLYSHERYVHLRIRQGLCSICGFQSKNLVSHMQKHVRPRSAYRGLCFVCGKDVANISNHMALHTNHRPHKCQKCSKAFASSQTLKKHQIVHSGLKPYACVICSKKFNSQYNLRVHERIHIGKKCHVCKVCDKGFLEKSYLRKHMRVHANLDNEEDYMTYRDEEDFETYKIEVEDHEITTGFNEN